MTYDIVIIGSGPTGSTLARLLGKKYKILLVDKRNLDNNTNINSNLTKSCGGLLAPDAQKVLSILGLGIPNEILTGPQMFSVKTIDFDNSIESYYQRNYINIDREKFDRWLVSLVGDNVELQMNCIFKRYFIKDGLIKIKLSKNDENFYIHTKLLIGADGALSQVRKQAFKLKPVPDEYVAVEEWFNVSSVIPYYVSIFDSEVTDFYSWIIQKQNRLLLGTAIPKNNSINQKYNLLKQKLTDRGFKFDDIYKRTGTLLFRPRNLNQISLVNKENIALAGEAAGFISPSSAEGISYSLKSAIYLADSINTDFDNFAGFYSKKTTKLKLNIIGKNLKIPFMYNTSIRKLIIKSKLLSIKVHDTMKT